MITNLMACVTICLVTNWTGVTVQNQELGYVVEQHTLTVDYHGERKEFVLNSVLKPEARWRKYEPGMLSITNSWDPYYPAPFTNIIVTNFLFVPNAATAIDCKE